MPSQDQCQRNPGIDMGRVAISLGRIGTDYYNGLMDLATANRNRILVLTVAVSIGALVAGAAFAGWLHHSADIFLAYASAGLAWCF